MFRAFERKMDDTLEQRDRLLTQHLQTTLEEREVLAMSDILLKVTEVAKAVGIATSTVRKYSFLIEKHGYKFNRNNQNALMFDQDEVNMFKELVQLKKQKNITLENAVQQLLSNMSGAMSKNMSDMSQKLDTLDTLVDQIKTSEKKQIEEHDKILMQSIRAEQQMKKMELRIEKLQKQIAVAQEKEKKSWWKKIFSK